MPQDFKYSEKYHDDMYEYRHVIMAPDITKKVPKGKLLTEAEWRQLGVQQSCGWEHYAVHRPEPHILLFRRLLTESPAPPPGAIKNKSANTTVNATILAQK